MEKPTPEELQEIHNKKMKRKSKNAKIYIKKGGGTVIKPRATKSEIDWYEYLKGRKGWKVDRGVSR